MGPPRLFRVIIFIYTRPTLYILVPHISLSLMCCLHFLFAVSVFLIYMLCFVYGGHRGVPDIGGGVPHIGGGGESQT